MTVDSIVQSLVYCSFRRKLVPIYILFSFSGLQVLHYKIFPCGELILHNSYSLISFLFDGIVMAASLVGNADGKYVLIIVLMESTNRLLIVNINLNRPIVYLGDRLQLYIISPSAQNSLLADIVFYVL